ncbi:MAG: FkbM family methyltransferase [Terriglobales bacterium]
MKINVVWNDTGGQAIWRDGWYEPPTVKVISDLLRPGMTFFDVGANVGQYTLLAIGLDCEVHSFEPAPAIFQFLSDNVKEMTKPAHINQCALSDSEDTATLYIATPDNLGATSLSKQYCHSGETFQIACTTIDNYMQKNGIAKVDAIKIDVEGAESAVLRGAEKLLSGPHRPWIVIEYEEAAQSRFGSSCAELTKFLTAHGYRLERVTDEGVIPYTPKEPDDYTFNILARPAVAITTAAAAQRFQPSAVSLC